MGVEQLKFSCLKVQLSPVACAAAEAVACAARLAVSCAFNEANLSPFFFFLRFNSAPAAHNSPEAVLRRTFDLILHLWLSTHTSQICSARGPTAASAPQEAQHAHNNETRSPAAAAAVLRQPEHRHRGGAQPLRNEPGQTDLAHMSPRLAAPT